jgi:hypothetical protein
MLVPLSIKLPCDSAGGLDFSRGDILRAFGRLTYSDRASNMNKVRPLAAKVFLN